MRRSLALTLAVLVSLGVGCGGKTSESGQWLHTDSGSHDVGLTSTTGDPCLEYFGGSRRETCVAFYNVYPSPKECGFDGDVVAADRCARVCGPDATCSVSSLSPGGVTCTSTLSKCMSCTIEEIGHLSDGCGRTFWVSPTLASCGFTAKLDAAACASICGSASDTCSLVGTDYDATSTVQCNKVDPSCPRR
jgi:hypothetical protein